MKSVTALYMGALSVVEPVVRGYPRMVSSAALNRRPLATTGSPAGKLSGRTALLHFSDQVAASSLSRFSLSASPRRVLLPPDVGQVWLPPPGFTWMVRSIQKAQSDSRLMRPHLRPTLETCFAPQLSTIVALGLYFCLTRG